MKHRLSFFLFFAVCVHAQDAAKPNGQQPEPGVANYYGAYTPGAEPTFNHNPNAFLVECVRNRRPGKALDVGMGSGRTSIYLASHGWDVTAFDVAEVGVDQARRRATPNGRCRPSAFSMYTLRGWHRSVRAAMDPGMKVGQPTLNSLLVPR